jgi:hypothetical protein
LYLLGWSGSESTVTEATKWPIVIALDDDGAIGGMIGKEKLKYSQKTYLSTALFTTNPTSLHPDSNSGLCGG